MKTVNKKKKNVVTHDVGSGNQSKTEWVDNIKPLTFRSLLPVPEVTEFDTDIDTWKSGWNQYNLAVQLSRTSLDDFIDIGFQETQKLELEPFN